MDPFTAAFVAKSAFNVVNAFDQANARRKQADLTRQLAQLNKQASDRNAFEYLSKGLGKANAYKSQADLQIAKQNVAYAYADVDTSFGSARMVQEQSRLNALFNTRQLEDAAYSQALGEQMKGLQYAYQGEMTAASMDQQARQIVTSAILKGATDVGLNWDKLQASNADLTTQETTYDALVNELTLTGSNQKQPNTSGLSLGVSYGGPSLTY